MSKAKSNIPRRAIDGILLLDKPLGLSSNQALQQAKRLFRAEKAGHTGALDPLATGLLPLCFGQATKISGYLLDSDKRYLARLRLGQRTSTGDAEGQVIATSDVSGLSREQLENAAKSVTGLIRQVPPMYSALKRDGEPLYKLARQGIEIEREPREVTIHSLRITDFGPGECEIDVTCSKGTYIRTLAEDLAQAAGQQAHLSALRRTEVGAFRGMRLWAMAELENLAGQGEEALDACLTPPAAALSHWPQVVLDAAQIIALGHGRFVDTTQPLPGGLLALLDAKGRLLGMGEAGEDGRLQPRRWMAGTEKAP